jgi:DNA-binding TFAR19-related protein (PDSD5 family)
MDADELQRIRQARIAEMQAQAGSQDRGRAGPTGAGSQLSQEEQAAQREQAANERFNMLSQILDVWSHQVLSVLLTCSKQHGIDCAGLRS